MSRRNYMGTFLSDMKDARRAYGLTDARYRMADNKAASHRAFRRTSKQLLRCGQPPEKVSMGWYGIGDVYKRRGGQRDG
jgi:hypothetical protein